MDLNTALIILLTKDAPPPRWEDEPRGSWDIEQLRKEFRERLHATPPKQSD